MSVIPIAIFSALLMFYEIYWVVDPLTLSYLKKRTKNNNSYPEYFPILHIYPELIVAKIEKNTNQEEKDDDIENKPKKKYLRID